jgi:cellulose synthase/poly-beta-1,6-N-acetylglucosamine synthase-like glycosyltransferase
MSSQFVTSLVYQPVELLTEYTIKQINGSTYHKLKKVEGISPLFPETNFKPSVLTEMMKTDGELEFLIVVTMYNEDRANFKDTMHGIVKNLKIFESDGLDTNLIGCIVIVDGIKPFMQTYKKDDQKPFFSNFFNEQMIKDRFQVDDVINGIKLEEDQEIAHCFMTSTNFGLEGCPDLNMIFAVKQLNKRKLNTHLWFFGGFCEMIQPKFVMLIDVGTKPLPNSLCCLYDVLKTEPNIAGVCGEIAPMDPEFSNIVVSAQTVEYTFSHIFDKAMESCLGYIGVLPGAFSAYRWEALCNGPLMNDYFKSMTSPEIMNAYNSNIFLAEDRVLSLSLVSKPGNQYLLRFVHTAIAETDVPAKLFELLSQRRRWINGSWFALIDTWRSFGKIKKSDHTKWRKIWFGFQLVYFGTTILFSWVMVGSFYLFTELIFFAIFGNIGEGSIVTLTQLLLAIYISMILLVFMMSLGVKTNRVQGTYRCISFGFAFYMFFTFICTLWYTFTNTLNAFSWVLVSCTMGSYAIGTLITGNVKKVIMRTIQFLLMTPVYVNVFQIYAICNIHDCSWGNRPDMMTEEEKARREEFEHYRTKWVIIWIVCNLVYVKAFETFVQLDSDKVALYVLYTMAMIMITIRFIGCLAFYIHNWFEGKGAKKYIRLGAKGELNADDKQLLTEIVSKKGKRLTQKEIRNSILGAIDKRGGERRATEFQKQLAKKIRRSQLLEESNDLSDSYESSEEEEQMTEFKKRNKTMRKKSTPKEKKSRRASMKEIRKNKDESVEKALEEIIGDKKVKKGKNEPDIVHQGNGKFKKGDKDKLDLFEESKDSDELDLKTNGKNVAGVMNFEDTVQKEFDWNNEPENEDSKVKEESDVNKYLDMLSLIISNISESEGN